MFSGRRRPEAFHAEPEHVNRIFVTGGFEGFDGRSGVLVDCSREDVALHTQKNVFSWIGNDFLGAQILT
jgi:hypothetical protein